jgi:hypothetical protein
MYRISETFVPTGPNRFAILSEDYVESTPVKVEKKAKTGRQKVVKTTDAPRMTEKKI